MSSGRGEAFEEDRPRPRPRRDAADEKRRRGKSEEDIEEPRPRSRGDDDVQKRRRRDLEDDEDERRPRRRRRPREDDDGGISSLIPYKNGKALAAYYCGVFALIPCVGLILGPVALIFGILGVRFAKENPEARGMGHAIAGIVLGSLVLVAHLAVIVVFAIAAANAPHR
jgi:hypothetical protein